MSHLPTIDTALKTLFKYRPNMRGEYNTAVEAGRMPLIKLIRKWGSKQFSVIEINEWIIASNIVDPN